MTYSSLIIDYLGEGLAAARPASLSISPTALGLYFATDTLALSAWDGSAWQSVGGGLSAIANNEVLANISGGSAVPIGNTLSDLIDSAIGTTQGDILYRGASAWSVLAPGTAGQALITGGASADPSWGTPPVVGTAGMVGLPGTPTFSSSAFAWKGLLLTLTQNMTVYSAQAQINATSGQTFQAAVVSISAGVIGAVIGLSNVITAPSTNQFVFDFDFASPPALSSGTVYGLLIGITGATGTTPMQIAAPTTGFIHSPRSVSATYGPRVASVALTAGGAVDATSTTNGFYISFLYS